MSNRIRKVRRQRGMTQSELADRIGLSRAYLSQIENNRHEAGGWLMLKIADQLGATVEELFEIDEMQQA